MKTLTTKKVDGMTPSQFEIISSIVHKEAGLVFPPAKSAFVSSRLSKRLRGLNISNFEDYCKIVSSTEGRGEIRNMISALTTNVSSFFREDHHFKALNDHVFPELVALARKGKRVRIWSAGSSIGMEAYSIGMTLLQALPEAPSLDIKILATDINPNVLIIGNKGSFDEQQLKTVPPALQARYFNTPCADDPNKFQASQELKSIITFRELNLLEKWPIGGTFDIIFCRNTVIYFDKNTQNQLWPRFQNALVPEGWLFIGHSERVPDDSNTDFENVGMTIYRRRANITQLSNNITSKQYE